MMFVITRNRLLISLIFCAFAAAAFHLAYSPGSIVASADPAQPIELCPEMESVIRIVFRNNTVQRVRLVGVEDTCGPDGCVEVASGLPLEILPQSQTMFPILFRAPIHEGAYIRRLRFFTDCVSQPEVIVSIRVIVSPNAPVADEGTFENEENRTPRS